MFQMSFSASRATRLLVAVGVAWLGLALSAQAAHATYGKVQIVKINQGGDANDSFTFDTGLTPVAEPVDVHAQGRPDEQRLQRRVQRLERVHTRWGTLTQTVTERPAAGYTLTDVACRITQRQRLRGGPPRPARTRRSTRTRSSIRPPGKITFKLHWCE